MTLTRLVLGGARSGKSRFAETLAQTHFNPSQVIYLATATACDEEMAQRIAHHRRQRPVDWQLHEVPYDLVDTLQAITKPDQLIVIDCLTLWLNNLLFRGDSDAQISHQVDVLCRVISHSPIPLIFVSNEVGQGIIADHPLARRFVDQAGFMNQKVAQVVSQVIWVVAGLPQWLKGKPDDAQ